MTDKKLGFLNTFKSYGLGLFMVFILLMPSRKIHSNSLQDMGHFNQNMGLSEFQNLGLEAFNDMGLSAWGDFGWSQWHDMGWSQWQNLGWSNCRIWVLATGLISVLAPGKI